ncbi:MAG: membrane protein insertion efficiency factor YidD [Thermodesulfovibrionales bacterium]
MTHLLIQLVKAYRYLISPLIPSSCRFKPSCSEYCIEALQRYGLLKGITRSAYRILRCNPLSKGGYDPVK